MRTVDLGDVAEQGVSHDPTVAKRVLVAAGQVPGLTNLSQARMRPGQQVGCHRHLDMWEVFLVEAGRGTIMVDGVNVDLVPGSCVVVEPGEGHTLANTGEDDLAVTYFGVAPRPGQDRAVP